MPPKDSQPPSTRDETLPACQPAPPAIAGVRVIVRDIPPDEPVEEPEAPVSQPKTVILPPGQSAQDRDAYLAWLDAHWGDFIQKTVLAQGGVSEESTKDVRQQVLLILCDQHDRDVRPEHMMPFLQRVIQNETWNHVRRWKAPIDDGADLEGALDSAHGPESAVALAEQWERLQRHFAELTPQEKELVEARALQGLTFKQIAEALDQPLATIARQYARAIEKLRELALASDPAPGTSQ